jgi:hypothetical protein
LRGEARARGRLRLEARALAGRGRLRGEGACGARAPAESAPWVWGRPALDPRAWAQSRLCATEHACTQPRLIHTPSPHAHSLAS